MKIIRVNLVLLPALLVSASLHSTEAAAACPVTNAMLNSPAYIKCATATGATLSDKAPSVNLSPTVFCANTDCYAVWSTFDGANQLRCYQQYSIGAYSLKTSDSGAKCFKDNLPSTTPVSTPATTPAAAPVVPPAPAVPLIAPTPTTKAPLSPSNPDSPAASTKTEPSSTTSATTPNSSPSSDITTTAKPAVGGSVAASSSVHDTAEARGSGTGGNGEASNGVITDAGGSEAGRKETTSIAGGATSENQGSNATSSGVSESTPSASAKDSETATTGETNKSGKTRDDSEGAPGGPYNRDGADDDEGSSSLWVGAGISAGLLVVIFIAFSHIRRRRASATNTKALDSPEGVDDLPTLNADRSRRSNNDSFAIMGDAGYAGFTAPPFKFAFGEDEVIAAARIPLEKLKRGILISRGGYGEVYRGTYRDDVVAIKTLLPARRNDMRQIENFFAEVKIMATLEHQHIVRFIGVAWDALNELCVVSEFLTRGDLRTLLSQYAAKASVVPRGFSQEKVKIAMHVAHALTYMHSLQPMVLHRDLKSRNILLDEELNAKITDFGVSRERADSTMTIGVGSSLWMAPEVMTGGRYNDKADVFSFGVVLSELDTHTLPYSHAVEPGTGRKLPDTVVVQMMTTGRLTVEFTDDSPMAQLGRRCVALDPNERPSAAEVQHQIHQLFRTTTASRK